MMFVATLIFAIITIATGAPFPDWLVTPVMTPTQLLSVGNGTYRLTNGLISRDFIIKPAFATVDYYSHEWKLSLLRAISPEAVVNVDGIYYNVGGLLTNIPRAYLNRTALAQNMTFDPNAFEFVGFKTTKPEAPFKYRPRRGAPADIVWPPAGLRLDVEFKAPFWAPLYHQMLTVTVHWEMYDGIPLMSKWVSITGGPQVQDKVEVFVASVEYLAVNWQWAQQGYGWMHILNDVPHTTVAWTIDPASGAMPGSFEAVVNCTYPQGGLVPLAQGFESFRVHELIVGSSDPERFGLALRRKMRLLAPHTQENPIFFHMSSGKSADVRAAIDQMADIGFEMMIYSFGSGFDIESDNEEYLKQMKEDIAYANNRSIEVGGYDLIVLTREVPSYWMDVGGDGACIASAWYEYLLNRVLKFMDLTGLSMIETDGPYPGYQCSSTNHSHHRGLDDSVYWQLKLQSQFYRILREREVYINQPDDYFFQGGSKTAMGYDESQYSLPRWQDISVSRQGMFDDTFHYTPTVGWMFVPLVQYHGGGEAAMFEPLSQHLVEYEWALAQYLGAGVAACYRGPRLYDTPETRAVVKRWVDFYKKYRDILISDIIHVRRPDMQGIDAYLHVNPSLKIKGLMMVFNPTHEHIIDTLTVPLYYTGLTDTAVVSERAETSTKYELDRKYNIELPIDLQPLNITWFLLQ